MAVSGWAEGECEKARLSKLEHRHLSETLASARHWQLGPRRVSAPQRGGRSSHMVKETASFASHVAQVKMLFAQPRGGHAQGL